MTAEAATEHQVKGWLALYHDQQVRVVMRPNEHNLCRVCSPDLSAYAFLHELKAVIGPDGGPVVDPGFDPNLKY